MFSPTYGRTIKLLATELIVFESVQLRTRPQELSVTSTTTELDGSPRLLVPLLAPMPKLMQLPLYVPAIAYEAINT
jgi:hypothetical protein